MSTRNLEVPSRLAGPAQFLRSAADIRSWPPDSGVEVAFVGRSNAGKSSAINLLTGIRGLARVSRNPGRTRLLNFFTLGAASTDRRLVDLPGYGYAKVPPEERKRWRRMVGTYLSRRDSLIGIVLIMDVRHPLMPNDRQLLDFVAAHTGAPVHILLTRSDKLSRQQGQQSLRNTTETLQQEAAHKAHTLQLFSALKKQGTAEAVAKLSAWLD